MLDFGLRDIGAMTIFIMAILSIVLPMIVNRDKEISAGAHNIVWDGKNNTGEHVSTSLYYYKLEADNFVKTRKMVLLK